MRFSIIFLFAAILIFSKSLSAQTHQYVYKNPKDSTRNCYLKVIPAGQPKGLLVFPTLTLLRFLDSKTFTIHRLAQEQGILTLFIGLGSLQLYFNDSALGYYDDIIHEVMIEHGIPKDKFVIGGLSMHGVGAMKFAMY